MSFLEIEKIRFFHCIRFFVVIVVSLFGCQFVLRKVMIWTGSSNVVAQKEAFIGSNSAKDLSREMCSCSCCPLAVERFSVDLICSLAVSVRIDDRHPNFCNKTVRCFPSCLPRSWALPFTTPLQNLVGPDRHNLYLMHARKEI